jgi:hypothetical protein
MCSILGRQRRSDDGIAATRQAQPESLTLTGTTLRWLEEDGEARTTTLR